MIQNIDEIVKKFSEIGVHLERKSTPYSFGTLEECKKYLKTCIIRLDGTITEDQFVWLPQYDKIALWMSDTKGKGLFLRGGNGLGKSTIIYSVMPVLFNLKHNVFIKPYLAHEINDDEDIMRQAVFCIDDVGTEAIKVDYGEKKNVFAEIVDDAEQHRKMLLLNSNLRSNELAERYGQRIVDRILQNCYCIDFVLKDAKGNKVEIKSLRRSANKEFK